MQRKLILTVLLALFGAMTYLPRGSAQRSPYVPMPVNLPGLLPRFGEVDNSNAAASASSSSSGQSAPSFGGGSSTSSAENVGTRLGEDDRFSRPAVDRPAPSRPSPSRGQTRCPPNQVPCYDCVVYISRDGRITRYMSSDQGGGN